MSRDYAQTRRPDDTGPAGHLEPPVSDLAAQTPGAVPVAGVARAAQRPIARKGGTGADPLGGTEAGTDVVDALRRRRGGGAPLPGDVAQSFGQQLGTDLSTVRVHTDSEADGISRSVGAQAFTHGTDIYFTSGTYNTGASGQRLLAHELAHVAQNATGRFRPSGPGTQIGRADDPAERDADRTADHVVSALRRTAAPAPSPDEVAGDHAADLPIRRNVAELTKWHEEKIAQQGTGANAYATEMKDSDRPDGVYSTPELSEEKEAESGEGGDRPANDYATEMKDIDRPEGAYSVPELTEEKQGKEAEAGGGEHAAGTYSEFKPGDGGGAGAEAKDGGAGDGRPANAYAEKFEDAKPAGGAAYSKPELHEDEKEAEGEGGGGSEAGGAGAGGGGAGGGPEGKDLDAALAEGDKEQAAEEKEAHTPGTSRKHRAWLMAELDSSYANEEGSSKQGIFAALKPHLNRVKVYWEALAAIDKLPPRKSAGYADKAAALLADLHARIEGVGQWGKTFATETKDMDLAALTSALLSEHAKCKEWLLRQDLPIRNDGTLNLKEVKVGGETQYDMSSRVVKYLSEEERTAAQVSFAGGVLKRDANWKPTTKAGAKEKDKSGGEPGGAIPVNTDKSVTHFTGPGWEIFVASGEGEMFMTSHKVGMMHHSSLLGGRPVLVAGEIKAVGGRIQEMSNKSGHYLPSPEQFAQFLHFLHKDGIPLDFKVAGFGVGTGRTGADLIAGRDKDGNIDPRLTYDAIKTRVVFKSFAQEFGQDRVLEVIAAEGWHMDAAGAEVRNGEDKAVDLKVIRQTLKEKLGKKPRRTLQQREMSATGPKMKGQRWTE